MQGVRPLRSSDPSSVGPYALTGFLGEGGQGSVYLGLSPSGEQVAIKLLHARFAEDEQAVRRFRREAESARRVAEFCTARVLEVGTVENQPYIVGEYVDGPSLQQHVTQEGPIRGPGLMRLAITTATALVAIHGAGVVHRDFKPNNVLLGPDGPRVIDFGIARALDVSQSLTTGIVGTPAFMAPEQFLGEASPAADVFAWAGTMVFAATGRGAFGFGPLPVVMHRILNADPDLTGVPGELAPLLWASLAKDARYRPTAEQLIRDLIRAGTAPPPPPGSTRPLPADSVPMEGASGPPPGSAHPLPADSAPASSGGPPPLAGAGFSGGAAGPPGAGPMGGALGSSPNGGAGPGTGPSGGMPYPVGDPPYGRQTPPQGWQVPPQGMPPRQATTTAPSKRIRRTLIPVAAATTALMVGAAVWLVSQANQPGVARPTSSPVAEMRFGAAEEAVAMPSAKTGGTLRVVSTSTPETDPGNMYLPDSLNLVRLYGRSLTMFRPVPGQAGTQVVPDLAESLGVPSDGAKTWTYKLRQGLKYQDGTPITAKDVKYAVLRAMDADLSSGPRYFDLMLDLPSGYQGGYRSANVNTDAAVETPDERTIVFHLKAPYSTFDQVVQLPDTVPVPAAKDTKVQYGKNVIASGPYKMESVTDNKVILVRNDQWSAATDPNRKPLPDRYEIEYGLSSQDAYQRLKSGTADIGPVVPNENTAQLLGDPQLKARADAPVTSTVRMLAINPQVPPFDKVDCRRAVVQALDLNRLRLAYGSEQKPLPTSLLPPAVPGRHYADPNLTPDGSPEAAKRSLAACGHPTGFTATYIYRDVPNEVRAAQTVQASLARVGIKVALQRASVLDFHKTFAGSPAYLKKQKIGLISRSWGPDWLDPDSFLTLSADSRQITEEYSFNVSVRDKALDSLMDRARAEIDAGKRAGLWSQVESSLAAQAVLVPMAWQSLLLLRGQRVTNVHFSPAFANYDLLTTGLS
ncbi:ABC transporter substrate-binding protein [Nonomuraea purpurea]|uniref:ABC transporter substrate-binding protein n=1 Tax=Nonomuraea purpurea TaxID=1849276 RepID=A0ABV8G1Q2_9ACTN